MENALKPTSFSMPAFVAARFLVCALLAFSLCSAAIAESQLPQTSSDGLQLVPHSKVYALYVKPGITSLSQYTEVKILDCFVQFEANYQRNYNMNEIGLDGQMTTLEMTNITTKLSAEFTKVFTEEMVKRGHPVVDTTGPNVLLLRPAIINLDVTAPDMMTPGMSATFVASAGQMTLYMELYDSATSTLLARVIDPEAGQEGGIGMMANSVTNTMEADQILRHWADLLISHLGEAQQATPAQ
ncbi:MAG: DUF3313 family protein [Xanthomonadales bacterium]|nr:DUF3313 family protein [Xanthomonadales bacterium]